MNWKIVSVLMLGAALALGACGDDKDEDETCEGAGCACTVDTDCSDILTLKCDPFIGQCVARGGGGGGGEDTGNGGGGGGEDTGNGEDTTPVVPSECDNTADQAQIDLKMDDVGDCIEDCEMGAGLRGCFETCLAVMNLSAGCQECFDTFTDCIVDDCLGSCSGDACETCPDGCLEALDTCVGRPPDPEPPTPTEGSGGEGEGNGDGGDGEGSGAEGDGGDGEGSGDDGDA